MTSCADEDVRIEAHGGNSLPVSEAGVDCEAMIQLADGLCSMSTAGNQQNSSGLQAVQKLVDFAMQRWQIEQTAANSDDDQLATCGHEPQIPGVNGMYEALPEDLELCADSHRMSSSDPHIEIIRG